MLRQHDSLLQALSNPFHVIKSAFDSITPDMCINWISHAGYAHVCYVHAMNNDNCCEWFSQKLRLIRVAVGIVPE